MKVKESFTHASQIDAKKGFGGKFGLDKDRVDKSAVGWDYQEKLAKHASQKDYSTGFGGKFGVQSDRVDKSAVGWDYKEVVEKHQSQRGTGLVLQFVIFIITFFISIYLFILSLFRSFNWFWWEVWCAKR